MDAAYYLGRGELLLSSKDHIFIAREGIEDSLAHSPLCDHQFKKKVLFSPCRVLGVGALGPFTSKEILELDALCRGNFICKKCLRILNDKKLLAPRLLQTRLDHALELT